MLDKKSVSQYAHWYGWDKYEDSCLTTGPDCKLSLINISKKHNQVYTGMSMVMGIIFLKFYMIELIQMFLLKSWF